MKKYKSYNVKLAFNLLEQERAIIDDLLSKGKASARVIKRAQVLKLFDQGHTSPFIAEAVGLAAVGVRKIGWRYLNEGFERAIYEPFRPGQKRRLSEKQAQQIVALACSKAPDDRSRWTIELLVEYAIKRKIVKSVGRETIRILLKTHDLKPWREKNVVHPKSDT